MTGFWILLMCFGIVAAVSCIPMYWTGKARVLVGRTQREQSKSSRHKLPQISVIVPFRGTFSELQKNVEAIVNQDYPSFEIIVTTTADDESRHVLEKLAKQYVSKVKFAPGPSTQSGAQKLTNQLAALDVIDPNTEILMFIDSDGRPDPHYLRKMAAALEDENTGLATGWWWYIPEQKGFWGYARSCWNAGAIPFLFNSKCNIASGGAMAIRKEVFNKTGMRRVWKHAVSDGLSLTEAVKAMGMKVSFVPTAIMRSHVPPDFRSALEWTNRQATISHIYMPNWWRSTALAYVGQQTLVLAAVLGGLYCAGVVGGFGVLLVHICLQWMNAILMLRLAHTILPDHLRLTVRKDRMRYMFAAPAAGWLYGLNIVRSFFRRDIVWSGIRYRMDSKTMTTIVHKI